MKAARLVVLGVALAAGGVAAMLASGHHDAPPPPVAPPPPLATVDVLVAKSDLERGHVIADGEVDWQTWPEVSANPNFIKKTDRPDAVHQFSGAIVRIPLAGGEPIRDPAVVFAKGSGFCRKGSAPSRWKFRRRMQQAASSCPTIMSTLS
jgi:pilus assembly protein CpaB